MARIDQQAQLAARVDGIPPEVLLRTDRTLRYERGGMVYASDGKLGTLRQVVRRSARRRGHRACDRGRSHRSTRAHAAPGRPEDWRQRSLPGRNSRAVQCLVADRADARAEESHQSEHQAAQQRPAEQVSRPEYDPQRRPGLPRDRRACGGRERPAGGHVSWRRFIRRQETRRR